MLRVPHQLEDGGDLADGEGEELAAVAAVEQLRLQEENVFVAQAKLAAKIVFDFDTHGFGVVGFEQVVGLDCDAGADPVLRRAENEARDRYGLPSQERHRPAGGSNRVEKGAEDEEEHEEDDEADDAQQDGCGDGQTLIAGDANGVVGEDVELRKVAEDVGGEDDGESAKEECSGMGQGALAGERRVNR